LGDPIKINRIAEENKIDLSDIPIIDPRSDENDAQRELYAEIFFKNGSVKESIITRVRN